MIFHHCPYCGDPIRAGRRLCDTCLAKNLGRAVMTMPPPPQGTSPPPRRQQWDHFSAEPAAPEYPARPDLAGVPIEQMVTCPACGELNAPRLRCWICNRFLD